MADRPTHPEPVPAASQLLVLPFLSAVHGLLARDSNGAKLRITMHRVMSREGYGYLQQICTYFGSSSFDQSKAGRMFTVDTGIMGAAFDNSRIQRTRYYTTREALDADLRQDLEELGKESEFGQVPVSYVAIPFVGIEGKAVIILYADCDSLNFFAADDRLITLIDMCSKFCDLLDWINYEQPFELIRNYPLKIGALPYDRPTVFRRLQETVTMDPPKSKSLSSLNFDVSVA
ncbi:hypothetical protein [Bradyrhizobium guangdongense]|uniref:hypothetical protein n=1 Tax=Bradyrhizobium guangdongense TaxID=1325090 RepID=UPI001319F0AF|nr:hypothetical protein [Bradyrhizobium guangdongense]